MTASVRDQSLAARVVVRVLDPAGEPAGAGFLVGPERVATCAHVVAAAAGGDPYGDAPPPGRFRLDFPLPPEAAGAVPTEAEVVRWVPIGPDGSGDVAVLQLTGAAPAGARMPPLRRVDQLWDHPFRVLGFPEGMTDGVWSTGRFRGEQGTRWFQMQSAAGEQPIVAGYSGSPVWDEESGAVVGMTVASDATAATTTAYLIPIDQVLGLDPELLPCPYRGLEPFGEEHAAYYFGRSADVAQLADLVGRQSLVAVAGPSGIGKSSLVRAGLLPHLRVAGTESAEVRPVPGGSAAEALAAALRPFATGAPEPSGSDPRASVRALAATVTARLVLVVDQFEELVAADPEMAQELLETINDLLRPDEPGSEPGLHAVLTLRWATLDDVVVPELAGLLRVGTFLLPPMERTQLRDAIVAPAERAPGLSFEPGLVDRILDDAAGEPGGLPLVESLLTELWERRDGGHLTLRAYEHAGGVAGVVATRAEEVVAGFAEPGDDDRLRRLFTALAGPDREGRFTRRRRRWDELPADLQPLVQRLATGRLLVVETATTGERTVQLAHQALIAHWPRLRDWLTEDRDFLSWRDQLDQQRERWEHTGRDDGALLRGTSLAVAQDWLPRRGADVSVADRDYVRRSRARQRREVRLWRLVTAVLAVLVLAAGALAAVAVDRGDRLGEQLRLSNAEVMAQRALTRSDSDPAAATMLALAAWRLDPSNPQARRALLRQYLHFQSVDAVFAGTSRQQILAFGVLRDGTMIALDGDEWIMLRGLTTGNLDRWVVPGVPDGTDAAAVSSDGRWFAVSGPDGSLWVWDLAARSGPVRLSPPGPTAQGGTLGFAADGQQITRLTNVGAGVRELEIRDVQSGALIPHGLGPVTDPAVTAVWPVVDLGLAIVRIGERHEPDSRLVVRSLVDGSQVRSYPPGSAIADGERIVTCEQNDPEGPASAVVRQVGTGAPTKRFPLVGVNCGQVSMQRLISADGGHLIEHRAPEGGSDYAVLRITSLTEDRTYDVTFPPARVPRTTFAEMAAILPSGDGTATVLFPRGSSILRLRALPNPFGTAEDPPHLLLSNDGRYLVSEDPELGYTVLDRTSFEPLGRLPRDAMTDRGPGRISVDDALHLLVRTEQSNVLSDYALPGLELLARHVLPTRPGAGPAEFATAVRTDQHVVTFSDGILAAWDPPTDRPSGEPVDLAATPADREWYRSHALIRARPGHPAQVAVRTSGRRIELWDVVQGTRVSTLPRAQSALPIRFAFTPDGSRIVVLTTGGTLEVRDVDGGGLVRPPIAVRGVAEVIGVTADGYLLVAGDEGEVERIEFIDLATGREAGAIRISTAHDATPYAWRFETIDRTHLRLSGLGGDPGGVALPVQLELTAQAWFDRLCQVSDRPFTDAERALLPAGASADSPCRPRS